MSREGKGVRMWWLKPPPRSATQTARVGKRLGEVLGSRGTGAHVLATIPVDTASHVGMPGAAQPFSTVGTSYAFHIS